MLLFIHSTILASHCNHAFLSVNSMHLIIASKRLPLNFHSSFSIVHALLRRIGMYLNARTTPKSKRVHFVPVIVAFGVTLLVLCYLFSSPPKSVVMNSAKRVNKRLSWLRARYIDVCFVKFNRSNYFAPQK